MKILLVNKFYYRRGGDCIYMLNLEQLLKSKGHEVAVFAMDYPENIDTPYKKYFPSEVKFTPGWGMIESFRRPFGTKEVKSKFSMLLNDFNPDVVHLNNIHTQLSPIIAELAHKRAVRVVWTLHDYKLLCPRYDCLRNGDQPCEVCFGDSKSSVLRHSCMKDSKVASLLAYGEAKKWNRRRLEACTDVFIGPSQFMCDKMRQGGFDEKKMKALCNFIDVSKCKKDDYSVSDYYCYVGRLSHEKGISTLLDVAKQLPYKLKVVGGGDVLDLLKANAASDVIEFLGYQDWPQIKEIVGHARFMVIPSEWYENNPLSVIEAQCLGTPVLGARIGGIPELISPINGATFESRNREDLKSKIDWMWNAFFDHMAIAKSSMNKYSANVYYNELMKEYEG